MQTSQEKNSSASAHKASTPQSKLLTIKREFNVPVEDLFAAFTTPDAIKGWWWPNGLHTDRVDLDFREGGHYFINMKGAPQNGGGMVGNFEEITENSLIVMSDQFADDNGNAVSAAEIKMPGEWPETVYITFEFASLDENTSSVTLSQQGIPNEAQKDCKQGWGEMFDKLEKYLTQNKQ